jgi:hypothetical protein
MQAKAVGPHWHKRMPIEIAAQNVTIDHLVISGMRGRNLPNDAALCLTPDLRSLGGGLRITGDRFSLLNSALVNFTCYTAMEVVGKPVAVTAKNNVIADNGDHVHHHMWSDGITVHDATGADIENNQFVDNTDVQLIFGGCHNCTVAHNTLRHTGVAAGGSFADLMLFEWPHVTSGQYQGTTVSDNTIDCGPKKSCGFGLMIGPDPWIHAFVAGGTVSGNTIRRAMLGLNVDNLSGPMAITGNRVVNSGGRFLGACGMRDAPAVNISPASRKFVDVGTIERDAGMASAGEEFAGCILNYQGIRPAPR